jgi:hypothetical protein
MGSIGKYIFRTTLASLALIPVKLAALHRIAPAILTLLSFDRRTIPASGASNARPLRLAGRPVTA